MWIEPKVESLAGPARIGWVEVKENGRRLKYGMQIIRSLRGQGFKSNDFDMKTREKYGISGCRKEGRDALPKTNVEIDEDVLEEYWINLRHIPENVGKNKFCASDKYENPTLYQAGLKKTTLRGGRVTRRENGWLCQGMGSA